MSIEKAKQRTEKKEAAPEKGGQQRDDKSDNDKLTLFVKNISYDASEEDLQAHFENSVELRWPQNPDGSKKG